MGDAAASSGCCCLHWDPRIDDPLYWDRRSPLLKSTIPSTGIDPFSRFNVSPTGIDDPLYWDRRSPSLVSNDPPTGIDNPFPWERRSPSTFHWDRRSHQVPAILGPSPTTIPHSRSVGSTIPRLPALGSTIPSSPDHLRPLTRCFCKSSFIQRRHLPQSPHFFY